MSEQMLPVGFSMALAQNRQAMENFAAMTDYEKNSVIQQAGNVNSKREMQQLVSNIAGGNVQNFHPSGTNRQSGQ